MPARKKKLSPRKKPAQRRSRELVQVLLKATARILMKDGVSALNTNRIAEVAGVSVGSLYQYFPNKESLLSALIQEKILEDKAFFVDRLAGSESWSFEQRMKSLVFAGIELHRRDHKILKVLFSQLGVSDQLGLAAEMHGELFEILKVFLRGEEGEEAKEEVIREKAYLVLQLILGIWHSQVEKQWMDLDAESLTERSYRMIRAALEACRAAGNS